VNEADLWNLARQLMTDKQLEAFELVYGERNLTISETAWLLEVDESAVRDRIRRGIRAIRQHVRDEQTPKPMENGRARGRAPRTAAQGETGPHVARALRKAIAA